MKSKAIYIILIFALTTLSMFNICYAFDFAGYKPNTQPMGGTAVKEKWNSIVGGLKVIGTITSVITLAVIGIKYMTGSVEEKAEYKKTMVPYLIGAVLVFATSNLVQAIYEFANGLDK